MQFLEKNDIFTFTKIHLIDQFAIFVIIFEATKYGTHKILLQHLEKQIPYYANFMCNTECTYPRKTTYSFFFFFGKKVISQKDILLLLQEI